MDCLWYNEVLSLDQSVLSELGYDKPTELEKLTNQQYLNMLASVAKIPTLTVSIYHSHEPLFVEFCSIWLQNHAENFHTLEIASSLTRILPIAPHLSVYLEELICHKKAGVFKAICSKNVMGLTELPDSTLLELLLTMLRLLEFDNQKFAQIIYPSQIQLLLYHSRPYIRYLAVRLLCLFLHVADASALKMESKYLQDADAHGPWENKYIDYRFFNIWEEQRLADLKVAKLRRSMPRRSDREFNSSLRVIEAKDFSATTACFAGTLLPRMSGYQDGTSSLVMTPKTEENVRQIAKAVLDGRPVLISGLPGSGKSSIIRDIAQGLGKASSMLILHLNEQTDAKLLIGMYTSDATPGLFSWRPGILTSAVIEGRWVLIEDLDRAPADVLSTFLPLLNDGELIIPNLGGAIRPASGFKLISTIRSSLNVRQEEIIQRSNTIGARHWHRVHLHPLTKQDLEEIISAKFPILNAYQPKILSLYFGLRCLRLEGGEGIVSSPLKARLYNPQNLIKYCSRLSNLMLVAGLESGEEPISEGTTDNMFLETYDCFASSIPQKDVRDQVVAFIAQNLQISQLRVQYCLNARMPSFSIDASVRIGRLVLPKSTTPEHNPTLKFQIRKKPFALTSHSLRCLEAIGAAVNMNEPCLLVGETGTGKTAAVQQLADFMGRKLVVVNLSQQSEASDLLGGYKPVTIRSLAVPMKEEFDDLFEQTFTLGKNRHFLKSLGRTISKGEWTRTLSLWQEALRIVEATLGTGKARMHASEEKKPQKRRKTESSIFQNLKSSWANFSLKVTVFQRQIKSGEKGFHFSFTEGNIVKAVRSGDWVLLDEINLASSETLECLSDLLVDKSTGRPSLVLSETGNQERIFAHSNFRIFGAMNPATDVGKRDLPLSLRTQFTEYYIESSDRDFESLVGIIKIYIGCHLHGDLSAAHNVAELYFDIKKLEEGNRLVGGADQRPHFSLRTLTRTLIYVSDFIFIYGLRRALFEGFSMSFLTLLNKYSASLVLTLIERHLLGALPNSRAVLRQVPRRPTNDTKYIQFKHYWLAQGPTEPVEQSHYIMTPSVELNLLNLVRATSTRRFPVLLQGPTSSGKTSMIKYLAMLTGNKFVRINNHEHTDLQEYLGTYVSGSDGKLQYQEGVLIHALRNGYWVVLDELNLAPTDILEALNRLLDDNRELLIPETQQFVRPHPNFMLFATQNPPGLYGGRKTLSRAFRSRFLELHFDDIPEDELETILRERSQIAPSFCTRIVSVYKKLKVLRQTGRLFEQRNSFATLRDLFRWAFRPADDRQQLASNGYMLLGERVRKPDERLVVKRVIEEVMTANLDERQLYSESPMTVLGANDSYLAKPLPEIVWTHSMRRLHTLITHALKNNEPVLLVGETGCGKTTVCQIIAEAMCTQLHIVNAHQSTEAGDLIGAQRPVRDRSAFDNQLLQDLKALFQLHPGYAPSIDNLKELLEAYHGLPPDIVQECPMELCWRIQDNVKKRNVLFEWCDGSLVHAMKAGHHFLLDEISLADDSVLERLNSVLELDRTLLLAEKGPDEPTITAVDGFQFLATMNPGSDFGKKELSPALRNRFTEIWVSPLSDVEDLLPIVQSKLVSSMMHFAVPIVEFSTWYGRTYNESGARASIRDLLAWVAFINRFQTMDPYVCLLHGAAMVYIDGLGANPAANLLDVHGSLFEERFTCLKALSNFFLHDMKSIYFERPILSFSNTHLKIGLFELPIRSNASSDLNFSLQAPTTIDNAMRVTRALNLQKPILIEGSPGVGKTSLVAALAIAAGRSLTRINLSEQTDIIDLFGSDVPAEGEAAGQFTWYDAPFLQAMKRGEWVLLDEMNLASQSVLEGLNACLDHRGEVYVPELDRVFSRHPEFALFAAQNPYRQGGGRKGLPASFVNRFTVVYADILKSSDLLAICRQMYPNVADEVVGLCVQYLEELNELTKKPNALMNDGGPWEFNLRDLLRWLDLLSSANFMTAAGTAQDYLKLIFLQRFRHTDNSLVGFDTLHCLRINTKMAHSYYHNTSPLMYQCGLGLLKRQSMVQPHYYHQIGEPNFTLVESMMLCLQQNWPCLLVGSSGSGKTELIRFLGSKAGACITDLPMNAEMDIMDLIGGYEQSDSQRSIKELIRRVQIAANELAILELLCPSQIEPAVAVLDLVQSFTQLDYPNLDALSSLIRKIPQVPLFAQFHHLADELLALIEQHKIENGASFTWKDGVLIKVLEAGQWLILDNANLCSSSILDRLNSLLEPNGLLMVNEHQSSDGSSRIIKPHPDFRLFLTMDPVHGELSRAMRNRCVELFVPSMGNSNGLPFTSVLNYSTTRFRMFQQFDWDSLDAVRLRALVMLCCDHLTYADEKMFGSWLLQIRKGIIHLTSSRFKLFQSGLISFQKLLVEKPNIFARIAQYYRVLSINLAFEDNFVSIQSMHPLNNSLLLRIPDIVDPYSTLVWLGKIFDILIDIQFLADDLEAIKHSIPNKVACQLSQLERSIESHRIRKFARDPTQPLARFLRGGQAFLFTWIDDHLLQRSDVSVNSPSPDSAIFRSDVKDMLALIDETVCLLRDFLDLGHLSTLDEGVFQVHLSIGREISARAIQSPTLVEIGKEFNSLLDFFNPCWKLSTGGNMETLWKLFKPTTAIDMQQLEILIRLEELADRFDRLMWRSNSSFDRLHDIRLSIAQLYSDIELSREHAEDQLLIIEASLEGVDHDLKSSIGTHPYFQDVFEGLYQHSSIVKSVNSPPLDHLMGLLHLAAGRPSRQSLHLSSSTQAHTLLTQINDSTGILSTDFSLIPVRGVLPILIMKKAAAIRSVPLAALELLRKELKLLAHGMVVTSRHIYSSYRDLSSKLTMLHSEFYGSHSLYFTPSSNQVYMNYLRDLQPEVHKSSLGIDIAKVMDPATVMVPAKSAELQNALRDYFIPSLQYLETVFRSDTMKVELIAKAFVCFFVGCLVLYVPDRPFDPVLRPNVNQSRFMKRKSELETKVDVLHLFETKFSSQPSNFRCEQLKERIKSMGSQPQTSPTVRPVINQLLQLQGEFKNILQSIVQKIPNDSEISLLLNGSTTKKQEVKVLSDNISHIIRRLSNDYAAYRDITNSVVGFLGGLNIGLNLAAMAGQCDIDSNKQLRQIIRCTPLLGSQINCVNIEFDEPLSLRAKDFNMSLTYLNLVAIDHSITNPLKHSSTRQNVHQIFQFFFEEWKRQLVTRQDEHASKSSLYRYRGGLNENELNEEEDLQELFPNYDAVSAKNLERSECDFDVQILAQQLAHYQNIIFSKPQNLSLGILDLLRNSSAIITALLPGDCGSLYSTLPPEQLMPSAVLAVDAIYEKLLSSSCEDRNQNFYYDSNFREIQKLGSLVQRIQIRFKEIHEHWPEHATIGDVIQAGNEVLSFGHTEPLAKIITKCEQLHGFIHEWQKVASTEFGALSLYHELTTILVSWRRIELSTWARLLDMEDEKCRKDAEAWWFVAYESIIAAPLSILRIEGNIAKHTVQLLATLEEFFRSTSNGQFNHRLRLLVAFKNHLGLFLHDIPSLSVLRTALSNFIGFFGRYGEKIRQVVAEGRISLEKEVKEVLLLASWKDRNITALRESARRSHYKLFKIVRKYRKLLAQSAETILDQGLPESISGFSDPASVTVTRALETEHLDALLLCVKRVPKWSERPLRFLNTGATTSTIRRLSQISEATLDYSSYVDSFIANLRDTIRILQNETPLAMNANNRGTIKHLKSRKRKLFADVLREVRSMGFTSNLGTDMLCKQASLSDVLATTPAFESSPVENLTRAADDRFRRYLEDMKYIRRLARQHSDELSSGEVNRGVGYLEGILLIISQQRNSLETMISDAKLFESAIQMMQSLWDPEKYCICQKSTQDDCLFTPLEHCVLWMPSILDAVFTIVQIYQKMGKIDLGRVLEDLNRQKTLFVKLIEDLHKLPRLPNGLSTSVHQEFQKKGNEALDSLSKSVRDWRERNPDISFVLKEIEPWIVRRQISVEQHESEIRPLELAEIDQNLIKILDKSLVGAQLLQEQLLIAPSSEEEGSWLVRATKVLAKSMQALHTSSIAKDLQAVSLLIRSVNPQDLEVAAAICATSLPILQTYGNVHSDGLHRFAKLHASLCSMASVLSASFKQILAEGFCSPADISKENDDDVGKPEGGLGFGEGKGTEDISNEIEDDEDLSDLAQGDKNRNSEDIEDEKNAIDMQQDVLEGTLGEAGEEGKADDDNQSQPSENPADEVGDVDELNDHIVDEKIWNGSTDPATEKKEVDQTIGTKENEMVAHDKPQDGRQDQAEEDSASDERGVDEIEEAAFENIESTESRIQEEENLNLPDEIDFDDDRHSTASSEDDSMSSNGETDGNEKGRDNNEVSDSDRETAEQITLDSDEDVVEDNAMNASTESPMDTDPENNEDDVREANLHDRTEDQEAEPNAFKDNTFNENATQGSGSNAKQPDKPENVGSTGTKNQNNADSDMGNADDDQAAADQGKIGNVSDKPILNAESQEQIQIAEERNAFQMLGEALQGWHRRNERIREAPQPDETKHIKPWGLEDSHQEFEHLPDEAADAETQALGAANEEQVQLLGQGELSSEMKDLMHDSIENDSLSNDDQEMKDLEWTFREPEFQDSERKSGAMIGNNVHETLMNEQPESLFDTRPQIIEDIDVDLSTIRLDPLEQPYTIPLDQAQRLWAHYTSLTLTLSNTLTSQLQLILAPTLATRLRGDFRTGKRLNIKRIIPYIASQYKRDKIWMRRSIPSKRAYQVMLAIDDSKSMRESGGSRLAFETLALVTKSLSMLEVGQMCIVGFGEKVRVALGFEEAFSSEIGANIVRQFSFQQARTDVRKLIVDSLALFREARAKATNSGAQLWQLQLIISDGVCEDHEAIRRLVRQATQERIMIVFVIVDALKGGESIVDMTQATFEPEAGGGAGGAKGAMKLKIKKYLEGFPFNYYLIVADVKELPNVLAGALRQWFAEVVES